MSDYILRLIHCLTKLFLKEKQIKAESSSKYSTPLRVPSRTGSTGCRNPDVLPALKATPISRKVPRSCPSIRCPSQISVKRFGSEDDISFRPDNFIRNRPFNGGLHKRINKQFDFEVDTVASNVAKNDDSTDNFPQAPSYKSSKTSLDYFVMAGDRLEPQTKQHERNKTTDNFPRVPSYKSSRTSLDYFVMAGDRLEPQAKQYERNFSTKRQFNLRNNQYLNAGNVGFSAKFNCTSSKIPVRNMNRYIFRPSGDYAKLPQRLRGRYTLASPPMNLSDVGDLQANEDTSDAVRFTSSDIGNWITYRNDTNTLFERTFKALSKKKHTIGNLIDSTAHALWVQLSGIDIDVDATMFRQFAGGKVVLTCGEYKFLIEKICKIHDLDYWDVLRQMATFYNGDPRQVEALLTSEQYEN